MLINEDTINKVKIMPDKYRQFMYQRVKRIPVEMFETEKHYRQEPRPGDEKSWQQVEKGVKWGKEWSSAWFRGDITLPEECQGQKVFIKAETGGEETLFMVNGEYKGGFNANHPVLMLTEDGQTGENYHLSFEAYAGHEIPGTQPQDSPRMYTGGEFKAEKEFGGIYLVLERENISGFVYDLQTLLSLYQSLDSNELRKSEIAKAFQKIFATISLVPESLESEQLSLQVKKAREIMRPLLDKKNGPTVPQVGLVGQSHMDTAWLWPLKETWRKCARTYSSVINLIEQYPDFVFIQSAPCHAEKLREEYPALFSEMQKKVESGNWEPNGGMYVEPDCNIPSGESFVRQLLIGQKLTEEMFAYRSDTLWLPDVFGYSAALPQILKGCGIEYFCTTKLGWNDTNRFPYDLFYWKGIDGSSVLSHLNEMMFDIKPESLKNNWNKVQHKDVQDRYLSAVGYGDGGGGPTKENLEIARRVKDLEGTPRLEETTVSDFMSEAQNELDQLPEWDGELYLELHRGTLTSIARIKKGNRKSEIALRDVEFLYSLADMEGATYPDSQLEELWKKVLINQFHDILPGTSIPEVNDEAIETYEQILTDSEQLKKEALKSLTGSQVDDVSLMVTNSLSWDRTGEVILEDVPASVSGKLPVDNQITGQWIKNIKDEESLVLDNINLPALGSKVVSFASGEKTIPEQKSAFTIKGNDIETPLTKVKLDDKGRIISCILKNSGREIVNSGGALNKLLLGEDVPASWDNWNIDQDQKLKMKEESRLINQEILSNGPLQLRIRQEYKIGAESRLVQDMVFHASTPRIDFETKIEWNEKHKLLKTSFDIDVLTQEARQEIQYGYVERPLHSNTTWDRAKHEVCNHKWTDLSENRFGVSLLNDCKYGISTGKKELKLSLMKSGTHPDPRGDNGRHYFNYAVLPHDCGFTVNSVVKPGYEFNVSPIVNMVNENIEGFASLVGIDVDNIIIEAIKKAEDGDGYVLRLYEAEKTATRCTLNFNKTISEIRETNMLEEKTKDIKLTENKVELEFKPFEIKTLVFKLGSN